MRARRAGRRTGVSVVLATFDGAAHLDAQLESLAGQTRLPDELVVRDDGSGDDSVAVVRRFARSAPFPVRVTAAEHAGYAATFVAAFAASRGDLVLFCDQDDVWHPEKVAVLETCWRLRPGRVYAHDFRLVAGRPERCADSYHALLATRGFSPLVAFKGFSLGVDRGLVQRWGWPPATSGISHDAWLGLLSAGTGRRWTIPRVLADHRLHDRNASGWLASDADRRHSVPGPGWDDLAVLVDLVVRDHRLGWTDHLLEVTGHRLTAQERAAAGAFDAVLVRNRERGRAQLPGG